MPKLTSLLSRCFAAALAAMAAEVSATGFGAGSSSTPLGQPLDFVVQMRSDGGDPLTSECVRADVALGDRQLARGSVRAAVETGTAGEVKVRVRTTLVVDEPVVSVDLSVGCQGQLSRRFVVFAEPPVVAVASTAPAFAAAPPLVAPPAAPAAGTEASSAAATPAPAPAPATEPALATLRLADGGAGAGAVRPGASTRVATGAQPRPPAASPDASAAPTPRPPRRARPARPAATSVAAAAAAAAPVARPEAPRLRLESAELPSRTDSEAIEQALAAVAQAASAARAAASAAAGAALRITALERTAEQLRIEVKANRDQATQMRDRLAQREVASQWFWWLVAAVLLLGALSAWMAWRLATVQRSRRGDWREAAGTASGSVARKDSAAAPAASAPVPFVTAPGVSLSRPAAHRPRGAPAWPPPAPPTKDPWTPSELSAELAGPPTMAVLDPGSKTQPLPPPSAADDGSPRDVSIEELIDLEQQAEFFVVLGQDDAAVELLVEHLRSTGGGSPLPYLKLLEIYRRLGDHEAYERTRARFNHRFNAYAPEWGADLAAGRSLEDYAGVVPRLIQVWGRPLDAMAELEALLFRKSRGELFDLPAYREVLFLYSLARDLMDRGAAPGSNVDFLLPMASGPEFGATSAAPYLGLETDSLPLDPVEDRPTAPLDLDVTVTGRPTSIFGQFDDSQLPDKRRR